MQIAPFVLALALSFVPHLTAAASESSHSFISDCRLAQKALQDPRNLPPDRDVSAIYWCAGYLSGFMNGVSLDSKIICPVAGTTPAQFVALYLKWADAHPQHWHLPVVFTVARSLRLAFPCKTKK